MEEYTETVVSHFMRQASHRVTIGMTIALSVLIASLLPFVTDHFRTTVGILHAQEEVPSAPPDVGPPTGAGEAESRGPTAEELAKLEREYGAPVGSFEDISPVTPQFEEPGPVSAELKALVPESDLVAIQCAMTKWKSGMFFRAMDGVKSIVYPAMAKARAVFSLETKQPDVDALKAEMKKRQAAICAAKTSDAASKLIGDAIQWSTKSLSPMDDLRREMQADLRAKGDELRQKTTAQIAEYVAGEKSRISPIISGKVKALVESMKGEFAAAAKDPDRQAALKARVDAQANAWAEEEVAALRTRIEDKVQDIVGKEKAKFEAVAAALRDLGPKMDQAVNAKEAEYDGYRREAFGLRTALVLKVFDRNSGEALAQLAKMKDQLTEAKRTDSTVLTYDEVVAQLAKDRAAIQSAGDLAAETGDENALQNSLNAFREKWAGYQASAQNAAGLASAQICPKALPQITAAKGKIAPQAAQIDGILARCNGAADEACAAAAPYLSRLADVRQKMGDLTAAMGAVETLCQTPEAADPDQLGELLRKLQSDGGSLRKLAQAFDADRGAIVADSSQKMCASAVPQIEAAENLLFREDLAALKGNLKKCVGANSPSCESVQAVSGDVAAFEKNALEFSKGVDRVRSLCRKAKVAPEIEQMDSSLRLLAEQGDALRVQADRLRAEQTERSTARAYCRAVTGEMESVRQDIALGLTEARGLQSACKGKKDKKCVFVNSSARLTAVVSGASAELADIGSVLTKCAAASSLPPDAILTALVEKTRSAQDSLLAELADLKRQIDAQLTVAGFQVEAEDAKAWNVRTGVSDPMARETNPSWRPATFGDGDWYMGRGGDYLELEITPKQPGKYWVWIRDLSSAISSQWGVREVTVSFDGKNFGTFAENLEGRSVPYPKGAFRWHKVGQVELSAGAHTMRVVKKASTSGAAILDSFWFTTDGQATPPEK